MRAIDHNHGDLPLEPSSWQGREIAAVGEPAAAPERSEHHPFPRARGKHGNPEHVKIQHAAAHFQLPCESWQLLSRGGAPGRTPGGFCEGLDHALLGWLAAKSIEVELSKLLLNNQSSFFAAPRARGLRLVLCKSFMAYHRPGAL